MHRDSGSKRFAWCLFAAALGIASAGLVQAAQPEADAAATPAAVDGSDGTPAAESPRRTRERRRDAQAATDAADAAAAATPATAETAAAATLAEPSAETVEARIVCKSYKRTGTRMARRLCGTPEQWAALGEATSDSAEEGMRQIRERSGLVPPSDNPLNPND